MNSLFSVIHPNWLAIAKSSMPRGEREPLGSVVVDEAGIEKQWGQALRALGQGANRLAQGAVTATGHVAGAAGDVAGGAGKIVGGVGAAAGKGLGKIGAGIKDAVTGGPKPPEPPRAGAQAGADDAGATRIMPSPRGDIRSVMQHEQARAEQEGDAEAMARRTRPTPRKPLPEEPFNPLAPWMGSPRAERRGISEFSPSPTSRDVREAGEPAPEEADPTISTPPPGFRVPRSGATAAPPTLSKDPILLPSVGRPLPMKPGQDVPRSPFAREGFGGPSTPDSRARQMRSGGPQANPPETEKAEAARLVDAVTKAMNAVLSANGVGA